MNRRHMRIYKLRANNPRREGTHGHYNWLLYRDGMTVDEYLNSPYDNTLPIKWGRTHETFTGPHMRHLDWDTAYGYVELRER